MLRSASSEISALMGDNLGSLASQSPFQAAAVAQLEDKVVLALRWCAENRQAILRDITNAEDVPQDSFTLPVRHVVVSGGVASNLFFRQRHVLPYVI